MQQQFPEYWAINRPDIVNDFNQWQKHIREQIKAHTQLERPDHERLVKSFEKLKASIFPDS